MAYARSRDGLAAADFFTVEVLTWRGLVRYAVFFVMALKTRAVEIAGIARQPGDLSRWRGTSPTCTMASSATPLDSISEMFSRTRWPAPRASRSSSKAMIFSKTDVGRVS